MNSKRWVLLAFIAGAGIGSVCTWQLLKRKYEQIAQEEIDSVKAAYAARENVEKAGKSLLEGLQDGLKKNEAQENEDLKKYKSIRCNRYLLNSLHTLNIIGSSFYTPNSWIANLSLFRKDF